MYHWDGGQDGEGKSHVQKNTHVLSPARLGLRDPGAGTVEVTKLTGGFPRLGRG